MRFAVLVCLLASALVASASQLQPFKQGHTYTYRFRTQVSSSLLGEQPSMIQQQAVTGMQAQLKLSFTNDRHARVQLQQVRLGEMNGQVQGGQQQLIPTEMFEKRQLPEEMKQKLETPFTISLVDGVVERINFQDSETSWTKNIKRAAINMLQLNLKRNDVQGLNMKSSQPQDEEEQRKLTVFSIPEITLEGECETHYTIQKRSSRYGQNEEQSQERESQQQQFNVTKNINFNKCQKTADVAYGFQPNPAQQLRCHKCLKQTEIKPQSVGKTEQQEKLKLSQCQMECQTNQLTNNKNIERTTVQQFELHGTTQKYVVRRSRTISQYVVKGQNPEAQNTISQIVAISELTLKEQSDDNTPVPNVEKLAKDETLLYVPEWDLNEKRFYMWGDEEFDAKRTPFSKVQRKPEQAEKFVAEILKQWAEDKEMGYELTSAITFNKFVQLVRQSTVAELKQIEQRVLQAVSMVEGKDERQSELVEHAKTLFLDALATAATRNSLHELVHKIKNRELSSPKAAQLIKIFVANQHSPSDRQADLLEQVANSEAAQQCPVLKQTAWLAFGSAIGKICQKQPGQSQEDHFRVEQLCPEAKKEQYKKTLIGEWKQAEKVYEQILALKVIGNSALEKVQPELQKIITDKRQPTLIRMEAIDALRRLRTSMPEKIQQTLLPIFQDQREQPEIRMAAVSMILYTQPAPVILDQIVFTVQNDRSQNVKSFVLTATDSLSKSPAAAEQHIAQHLKAALKIVKITPEQMRMSRKYQVPIYVSEQENTEEQNIFLGLASIVSPSNMIPVHLAASLRAAFNGDASQEKIQLSFTQKDLEQLYEKLSNIYENYQNEDGEQRERPSAKELGSVYSSLGIKSRRHGSYYLSSEESSESSETAKRSSKLGTNSPFGMIVLRTNDEDRAIIPIDEQKMPNLFRKFLNNEKPSFNADSYQELRSALAMGKRFQQHIAMNVGESKVKLPTTAGLPLAIIWQVSGVASVQGKVQAELHLGEQKVNGELKLRTSGIASHMHKTEIWTPVLISGVQSVRTVELNHGEVTMKVRAGYNKVEITIEPPKQEQKERILGLHTLPATYTQEFNWQTRTYGEEPRLKTIRNYALEHLQREYHAGQQHQQAIRVEGNVHRVQSLNQLINGLYTTENNVHVYFKQGQQTPERVTLTISGFSFRRSEQGEHSQPEFDDFYSKSSKRKAFQSIYEDQEDEQEYKQMGFQNNEERESRLSGYVSKYQFSKAYKHQLKAELEVRTPAKTHTAEIQLQGTCDQGLQHCKAIVNAQRTPYGQEQDNWTFQGKVQSVLPENIRGSESPEQKQSRLVVKAEADWGTGSQQNNVHVRLQGEPTRHSYWRPESKDWSSFLNKFDLVAEYQLQRPQRHIIQRAYEHLKAQYYWQLETQPERKGEANTIRASFVVDPVSRRQANFTVQTPQERVRVQMIELPTRVQGFSLERRQTNYHSFGQLVQSYTQQESSECRVDDRRVKTFDGVSYRAPLSTCWSVLAKDCRENPRFVVLMKKTEDEKKVKIITQENVIELQKEAGKKNLIVKVDGQTINDEEQLNEYGVQKSEFQIYVQQKGINVRFNGEEAFIKVAGIYKNIQCGLCGHYSDEESDIFRTSGNRRSESLKSFHQSYALKNEECDEQKLNKFYQDRDSQEFQIKPRKQQSAYYRDSFQRQDDEKSSEQFWTSSEESKENKQGQRPVDQTATLEYSQKICFSMKPVKKCPRNTVPDDSEPKSVKIQFFCLNRSTTEARRFQRQVRQGKIVKSEDQQPSFFDNVEQPTRCQPAEFY